MDERKIIDFIDALKGCKEKKQNDFKQCAHKTELDFEKLLHDPNYNLDDVLVSDENCDCFGCSLFDLIHRELDRIKLDNHYGNKLNIVTKEIDKARNEKGLEFLEMGLVISISEILSNLQSISKYYDRIISGIKIFEITKDIIYAEKVKRDK